MTDVVDTRLGELLGIRTQIASQHIASSDDSNQRPLPINDRHPNKMIRLEHMHHGSHIRMRHHAQWFAGHHVMSREVIQPFATIERGQQVELSPL